MPSSFSRLQTRPFLCRLGQPTYANAILGAGAMITRRATTTHLCANRPWPKGPHALFVPNIPKERQGRRTDRGGVRESRPVAPEVERPRPMATARGCGQKENPRSLTWSFWCGPNGIRTRVSTLRGWHPWPLDDGAGWGAWIRTRTTRSRIWRAAGLRYAPRERGHSTCPARVGQRGCAGRCAVQADATQSRSSAPARRSNSSPQLSLML